MRGLMAAVIGMGVLIVAGVAVIIVVLVHRMSSVSASIASAGTPVMTMTLDEPAGTRIVGTSTGADRLTLVLERPGAGGADRAVIVDLRSGRVVGRIGLAR